MLDPLTAFSLASNIFTFLDIGCKIVSKANEIRESTAGASDDVELHDIIAKDLAHVSKEILDKSKAVGSELATLAQQCVQEADKLRAVLDSVRVKGDKSKRKIMASAWKTVWKKDEIDNLDKRCTGIRNQLQTHVIFLMREHTMDGVDELRELKSEIQALNRSLSHTSSSNTNKLQELSNKLESLSTTGTTIISDQILKSLCFEDITRRHESLSEPHSGTFGWSLEKNTVGGGQSVRQTSRGPRATKGLHAPALFAEWLQSQDKVYWISGKPGSGKSTLVKFLCNHEETIAGLKAWAGPKELVTVSYFFWNAGSTMQKSLKGLLQSILYDVLRKRPSLISTLHAKWTSDIRHRRAEDPWEPSELMAALGQILQQPDIHVRFCFFIDGLDEFDGDYQVLIDLLRQLQLSPDLKLCLASRPENQFLDEFGQNPARALKLHDFNREDIEQFVRTSFEDNARYKQKRKVNSTYERLVKDIVLKSEGVFLWVVLVVRELLEGLQAGDDYSELSKTLDQIPSDLDRYFVQMFQSVRPNRRKRAAGYFQARLRAEKPVPLILLYFLDRNEDDPDYASKTPLKSWSKDELRETMEDMRARVRENCKGLLGLIEEPADHRDRYLYPQVEFLHKTALDFVKEGGLQKVLLELAESHDGPAYDLKICRAILAGLKNPISASVKYENYFLGQLADSSAEIFHENSSKMNMENPQLAQLLSTIEECENVYATYNPTTLRSSLSDFISDFMKRLAESAGADSSFYFRHRLKQDPHLIHRGRKPIWLYVIDCCYEPWKIMDRLIENGLNPNEQYGETTAWGAFMHKLENQPLLGAPEQILRTIQTFLCHGASLDKHLDQKFFVYSGPRYGDSSIQTESMIAKALKTDSVSREVFRDVDLHAYGEVKLSLFLTSKRKDPADAPQTIIWMAGQILGLLSLLLAAQGLAVDLNNVLEKAIFLSGPKKRDAKLAISVVSEDPTSESLGCKRITYGNTTTEIYYDNAVNFTWSMERAYRDDQWPYNSDDSDMTLELGETNYFSGHLDDLDMMVESGEPNDISEIPAFLDELAVGQLGKGALTRTAG